MRQYPNNNQPWNCFIMIVLYSSYLKAMLISTLKQDRREYLMGIYIRGIDEKVEAFSSDGHRLSK